MFSQRQKAVFCGNFAEKRRFCLRNIIYLRQIRRKSLKVYEFIEKKRQLSGSNGMKNIFINFGEKIKKTTALKILLSALSVLVLTSATLDFDEEATAQTHPVLIEIFSMSGCQFSKMAIRDFLPLTQNGDFAITVSFAGDYDENTGEISPALANGSLEEEKIWLAVQDLLPQSFGDFLFLAVESDLGDSKEIAESLGLYPDIFEEWSRDRGRALLIQNYKRALEFGIETCPSFIVNGQIMRISARNLLRNLCLTVENEDCFGHFRTAKVEIILPESKTPNLSADWVIENTFNDFFALEIDTLAMDSPRAQELVQRFEIDRLPAIILDNRFAWDWGDTEDGFYHKRERQVGETVILANRETIRALTRSLNRANRRNFHFLTDEGIVGWKIWRENQNLISGKDIEDAKSLLNYYGSAL